MDNQLRSQMFKLSTAAPRIDLTEQTLRRWVKQGKINVVYLPNGEMRITQAELDRLAEGAATQEVK